MFLEVAVTKLEEKAANYNEYQVGEPCERRAAFKSVAESRSWAAQPQARLCSTCRYSLSSRRSRRLGRVRSCLCRGWAELGCSKAKQLFTEKSRLWNLISDWKAVRLSPIETSERLEASCEGLCLSDRGSWMFGRRPTSPS